MKLAKEDVVIILAALSDFEPSDDFIKSHGPLKKETVKQLVEKIVKFYW